MDNKHIEFLFHGESTEDLKSLEDNSIDSVVCDPPYGLSKDPHISKVISKCVSGEDSFVQDGKGCMSKDRDCCVLRPSLWKEVFRVLKPGGHALVFAGTRTQDLMTIALRLAGFEVRDVIEFLYFSGFPKSHDVSKAFDRRAGAEREVVGRRWEENRKPNVKEAGRYGEYGADDGLLTAPATELARKYDGWGTALKPAHEPIIVVRKPLIDADTGRKLSVADCVEKYGTGAINIDASRIAFGDDENLDELAARTGGVGKTKFANDVLTSDMPRKGYKPVEQGRFPANCITIDSDEFYSKYFNVANITPAELSKKASKKD